MGAYYMATINTTMYDPHSIDNGLKLMEHSYVMNNYCTAVLNLLHENPQPLTWLCDYHEATDRCDLTWEICDEKPIHHGKFYPCVVNHSKEEYIDLGRWILENFHIHPIPILTNSDTGSQGGGDYHDEYFARGLWCGDVISTHSELPEKYKNFKNVTELYNLGKG